MLLRLTRGKIGRGRFDQEQWCLDVKLEMSIKEFFVDLCQWLAFHDAGVQHEDVYLAERSHSFIYKMFGAVGCRNVRTDGDGPSALCPYGLCDFVRLFFAMEIVDNYVCALFAQCLCDRSACRAR